MLGDLFGLVWEVSQFHYIDSPQAIEKRHGILHPRKDRAYLTSMPELLSNIEQAVPKDYRIENGKDMEISQAQKILREWFRK
jgi:hypothetical protein